MKFRLSVLGTFECQDITKASKILTALHDVALREHGRELVASLTQAMENGHDNKADKRGQVEDHASRNGRGRSAAAAAFDDDDDDEGGRVDATRDEGRDEDGGQNDRFAEPAAAAEPAKRGRGRPPASAKGTAAAGPGSGTQARGAGRPEGTGKAGRRDDDERAAEDGKGRSGGRDESAGASRGRGDTSGRGDDSDRDETGVTWDDEADDDMPDPVQKSHIMQKLTDLFSAMGLTAASDRKYVLDFLGEVAGVSQVGDIPEEGYAKVYRALRDEAELYASGKKKLKKAK